MRIIIYIVIVLIILYSVKIYIVNYTQIPIYEHLDNKLFDPLNNNFKTITGRDFVKNSCCLLHNLNEDKNRCEKAVKFSDMFSNLAWKYNLPGDAYRFETCSKLSKGIINSFKIYFFISLPSIRQNTSIIDDFLTMLNANKKHTLKQKILDKIDKTGQVILSVDLIENTNRLYLNTDEFGRAKLIVYQWDYINNINLFKKLYSFDDDIDPLSTISKTLDSKFISSIEGVFPRTLWNDIIYKKTNSGNSIYFKLAQELKMNEIQNLKIFLQNIYGKDDNLFELWYSQNANYYITWVAASNNNNNSTISLYFSSNISDNANIIRQLDKLRDKLMTIDNLFDYNT